MNRDLLLASAAEAIGATPLVALDRLTRRLGLAGRIVAKLEFLNPGHSKKDRAALQIIRDAEAERRLSPGQAVVEMTSGNMGTGLAIVCAVRGHPFIAVMSCGNSQERARMMRAVGAEVVLVEQAPGGRQGEVSGHDLELVNQETSRIVAQRGAFRADQFERDGSWRAHFAGTAPEIWQQSGGEVTAFCDFAGSGGTYAGCTRFFKQVRPQLRCYVIEPEGGAVLAGSGAVVSHPIQGGGYGRLLPLLRQVPVDGYLQVSGDQARETARMLARDEGLFVGYSSGANVAGAIELLRGRDAGGMVAVMLNDSGMKYLSTDLWT